MMFPRYDIAPDKNAWSVRDRTTGEPAKLNGRSQTGLRVEDADELAYFLSDGWLPENVPLPEGRHD